MQFYVMMARRSWVRGTAQRELLRFPAYEKTQSVIIRTLFDFQLSDLFRIR